MTYAICFSCGADKFGSMTRCESCGVSPLNEPDLALSFALSDHFQTKTQLQAIAYEIGNNRRLTIPESVLDEAREAVLDALNDPAMRTMFQSLGMTHEAEGDLASDSQTHISPAADEEPKMPDMNVNRVRNLGKSQLEKNPFAVLGVTTREDRRRIVEQAEEKSLELDQESCQKARSELTNPRMRLTAEMSWLPGMSPKKAEQYVSALQSDPMSLRGESGLPILAHLNLLSAAFEAVDTNDSADDVAEFIKEMAYLVDDLSPEQVLRAINEDRAISGFPEVKGVDQVEAELSERKRYYRNAIKDALNRLPSTSLVNTMTAVVDQITCGGEEHAPELIDDLVDSYAIETQGFLQKEAESVGKLIQMVRNSAKSGENAVKPIVDKLIVVARNWDNVAQPIQLSAKARGIDHESSLQLAYDIRSLAIFLFNEHDMLHQAQALTDVAKDLFAELPEIVEQVNKDADALDEISIDRARDAEKFKAYCLSGGRFKWKERYYDIEKIKHISWYRAVTTHRTNFVETGKTESADLLLKFDDGSSLRMAYDEDGWLWNTNKSSEIESLGEFYIYLSHQSFEKRLKFYEDQILKKGYWVYDDCQFYPRDKVVFRGKEFKRNASSFLKSYNSIEMRKKDFGALDKLKREVSLTKIPQFSTVMDRDVIFHLLEKHMNMTWKSD